MPLQQGMKDFTVLIVDDDLVFLEMVEGMLGMIGISRIVRATSGTFALEAVEEAKRTVDCVICDGKMDNVNGLQLLRAVRMGQIKQLRPDCCFILLT